MNKILKTTLYVAGGAAAGVGAIVMLPVFGTVGAVSMVGIAVGASTGGLVGGVVGISTDDSEAIKQAGNDGYKRGENDAKAQFKSQFDNPQKGFDKLLADCKDQHAYNDVILALFKVGMAYLSACGKATDENALQLREFVLGAAHEKMPVRIKKCMDEIVASPQDIAEAHAHLARYGQEARVLADMLLVLVNGLSNAQSKGREPGSWLQLCLG